MINDEIEKKMDEIHSRLKTESLITRNPLDYHKSYHEKCLQHVSIDGMWLEFGVYRGRSICTFAEKTEHNVYGFDSFEGLPEIWDSNNPKGCFNLRGEIPAGALEKRIVPGTVIAFDEICDYPDYREHEMKAFAELLIRTGLSYRPVVHQDLGYSQGCFVIE